jgi:hypothetical protein
MISTTVQLSRWLYLSHTTTGAGADAHDTNGDCVPDFSCCVPLAAAPFEEREHYVALAAKWIRTLDDEREVEALDAMFFGRAHHILIGDAIATNALGSVGFIASLAPANLHRRTPPPSGAQPPTPTS